LIKTFVMITALLLSTTLSTKLRTSTQAVYDNYYFIGTWSCSGYTCPNLPGGRTTEEVTITFDNLSLHQVVAIKSNANGDQCVTQGARTWTGSLPSTIQDGTSFATTFTVGGIGRPNSGQVGIQCRINSENQYVCWNGSMVCNRKGARQHKPDPNPPKPSGSGYDKYFFIGKWSCNGYTCPSKPGNIVEEITVSFNDANKNSITAIKSNANGDMCVTQGNKTWTAGNLPASLSDGTNVPVTFTLGMVGRPNSSNANSTCRINNQNQIQCWGGSIVCNRTTPYYKPGDKPRRCGKKSVQ